MKKKKEKHLKKFDAYYLTLHTLSPKQRILDRTYVVAHEKIEDYIEQSLLLDDLLESIDCLKAHVVENKIDNNKQNVQKEHINAYHKANVYQKYDNKNR
jgi:hypothetical protein